MTTQDHPGLKSLHAPRAAPVAVIGAGAAGLALAATLAEQGLEVRLGNRSGWRLKALKPDGTIDVHREHGPRTRIKIDVTSANIPAVVAGSGTVILAVSGGVEENILLGLLASLSDTTMIVLVSGRAGAAFACGHLLDECDLERTPVLVEFGLPFIAISEGPGSVRILGEKAWLPVATVPPSSADRAIGALQLIFPPVQEAVTPLWMTLHSIPGMVFPAVMVCNAGQIARGEDFAFYTDGVFPGIDGLLNAMDHERIAVAEALGLRPITAVEWFRRAYDVEGASLVDVLSRSGAYAARRAPSSLEHRFLVDNVALCVVPVVMFARRLGVATPTLDSVIELASALAGTDLRTAGEERATWIRQMFYGEA